MLKNKFFRQLLKGVSYFLRITVSRDVLSFRHSLFGNVFSVSVFNMFLFDIFQQLSSDNNVSDKECQLLTSTVYQATNKASTIGWPPIAYKKKVRRSFAWRKTEQNRFCASFSEIFASVIRTNEKNIYHRKRTKV